MTPIHDIYWVPIKCQVARRGLEWNVRGVWSPSKPRPPPFQADWHPCSHFSRLKGFLWNHFLLRNFWAKLCNLFIYIFKFPPREIWLLYPCCWKKRILWSVKMFSHVCGHHRCCASLGRKFPRTALAALQVFCFSSKLHRWLYLPVLSELQMKVSFKKKKKNLLALGEKYPETVSFVITPQSRMSTVFCFIGQQSR